MNKKEFSKESILQLIDEKKWQAEFWRNRAKTKKESEYYKGQIAMAEILKANIEAIWTNL